MAEPIGADNLAKLKKENKMQTETTKTTAAIPDELKNSDFGCPNCLWSGIECKNGSKYAPAIKGSGSLCRAYTYYD